MKRFLLGLVPLFFAASCGAEELATVTDFSLERYQGRWHQIALIPNRFQKHCIDETTADYRILPEGRLEVVNRCRVGEGEYDQVTGEGRIHRDFKDPARLQVRFAPKWLSWLDAVWGDYWVMSIDDAYTSVLVGAPNREYLWILSREPRIGDDRYKQLVALAMQAGFPADRIRREPTSR